MASIQNNLFRENQEQQTISGDTNVNEKRRSKSRSRVWEKVIWFTKKAKGGKDSKNSSESYTRSAEFSNSNITADADCLRVDNKTKQKVRKSRSFKYLKRRKFRQFGDEMSAVAVEEEANLRDCGTATGTFHDFESERRVSRHERENTPRNLLSEMARGMNPSQQKVKDVKSVLSLPLDGLSLNEVPSCDTFPRVRRSVSFSGAAYNSWPRKKRTCLDNVSRDDLLSPPSKQKRVCRIKKRATFSGFDSSRVNLKASFLSLYKEVKSTPHLPLTQGSHIRNQNGLAIGVIHFYKSPAIYQEEEASIKCFQHIKIKDAELDTGSSLHIPLIRLPSDDEKEEPMSPLLPEESHDIAIHMPDATGKCDANGICNECNMLQECSSHSNLTDAVASGSIDVDDTVNACLSFNIKSSDGQNSTISAFLLEGECSNSCIAASPDSSDENLAKPKEVLLSCSSELKEAENVNCSNESKLASESSCPVLGSKVVDKDELVRRNSGSDQPMDIPEHYTKECDVQTDKQILELSDIPEVGSSIAMATQATSDDKLNKSSNETLCDTEKPFPCLPMSADESRKVDGTLHSYGAGFERQSLQTRRENPWQRKPTVNGPQFKKHMEVTK